MLRRSSAYLTTSESGFYFWMYGNKNLIRTHTKVSTTYYRLMFGHIPTIYWNTPLSDLTQAASSGSSVTIHVTSTSGGFVAGNYYQIFGATGEGRDKVQVSGITNETDMVIASLPRNYGTGSYIGSCPSAFGCGAADLFYNTCPWTTAGTGNASGNLVKVTPVSQAYELPDVRSAMDMLQPMIFQQTSVSNYGLIGYCDAYIYAMYNSTYNSEDTFSVGQQDIGTAESGGASTLTDSDKSWGTNVWADKVIVITFGTGIGQIKKIASNTGTIITITDTWTVNPSSDSQYIICDEAYRIFEPNQTAHGCACREGT